MAVGNPFVAGGLGVAIGVEIISLLVAKRVITEAEGVQLYRTAVSKFATPEEQSDAKAILNGLMTRLNL